MESCGLQWTPENSRNAVSGWNKRSKYVITSGMALLMMRSSSSLPDGTVGGYVVALPDGATAFLNSVSGGGWELIIRHGGGLTDRRGLFGTPEDIMFVLQAEAGSPQLAKWPEVERRARPRSMD